MIEIVDKMDQIELLIRQGDIAQAATIIRLLHKKKVPNRFAARFAELARRADLSQVGLSVLYTIVRRPGLPPQGSAREIAEYAACLIRIGATDEAVSLLTPLTKSLPMASLYLAFAYINLLNNEAASEHLRLFLQNPDLDVYWRSIGICNLAACYTAMESPQRSQPLVSELLEYAAQQKLNFLLAACYELTAQNQILTGEIHGALSTLGNAAKLLGDSPSREAFFIKKWKAVAQWKIAPDSAEAKKTWATIHDEAIKRRSWETLRQLDFYEFQFTQDPLLFGKLYFGTRFAEFKSKVLKYSKLEKKPTDFLFLNPQAKIILDVTTAEIEPSQKNLARPEGLVHRTLQALCSDLYRPFRIPTLHAMIYPNEYYHPTGAKYRVHFAIKELRDALKDSKLPVQVARRGQEYQLQVSPQAALRMSDRKSTFGLEWDRTHAAFSDGLFTMREGAELLHLNERAMQRLLADWIGQGICAKVGRGPSTRYQLISEITSKKSA